MDTKDPDLNPNEEQSQEVIENIDEIIEMDDELLEVVEEDDEIPEVVPPPMPKPPKFIPKESGEHELIAISEEEIAYALPFVNELKDYEEDFNNLTSEQLINRYESMVDSLEDKVIKSQYVFEIGSLYEEIRDTKNCLKSYAKALDIYIPLRSNLWSLRRILKKKGLNEKVIALFEVEIKHEEDSLRKANLLYLTGIEYEEINNFEKSETNYREAISLNETHFPSLLALLRIREIAGDFEEVSNLIVKLSGIIENPEISSSMLLYAAYLLRKTGDYTKSEELLIRALEIDETHSDDIWFEREKVASERGDIQLIIECYKAKTDWYYSKENYAVAMGVALETSILMEQEKSDDIFSWLNSYSDNPDGEILIPRLVYLAWQSQNYEWLSKCENISDIYLSEYAKYKTGAKFSEQIDSLSKQLELLLLRDYGSKEKLLSPKSVELFKDIESSAFSFMVAIENYDSPETIKLLDAILEKQFDEEVFIFNYSLLCIHKNFEKAIELIEKYGSKLTEENQNFVFLELIRLILKLNKEDKLPKIYEYLPSVQRVNWVNILLGETNLISGKPDDSIMYYETAAESSEYEDEKILLYLEAGKISFNNNKFEKTEEIFEKISYHPMVKKVWELYLRLQNKTEELIATLEDRTDDISKFELGYRKIPEEDGTALEILMDIDRPEARWLSSMLALSNSDSILYADLIEKICEDYPEEKQWILGKAGVEINDTFKEDALPMIESALEINPDDYFLYQLFGEFAASSDNEELFFEKSIPASFSDWEILDRSFTFGWFREDIDKFNDLLKTEIKNSQYFKLKNMLKLMMALKFGSWEETVLLLPENEIVEDISRASVQHMLNNKLFHRESKNYQGNDHPALKALYEPEKALTSTLSEIFTHEIISDEFSSLVSITKELKGKLSKAGLSRKIDENYSILGALLAWKRHAKTLGLKNLEILQEARLADILPSDHPRRKIALENIVENCDPIENHEMCFKAWWQLWIVFSSGTNAIHKAFELSKTFEDKRIVEIVFNQWSEIVEGADIEREQNALIEVLSNDDSLKLPIDEISPLPFKLQVSSPLSDGDKTPGDYGKVKDVNVDPSLWMEDANLLMDLGNELDNEKWFFEAAMLYILAGNHSEAQNALESITNGFPLRDFLLLSIALNRGDSDESLKLFKKLAVNGSPLLTSCYMELCLLSEELPELENLKIDREYSLLVHIDYFSKMSDSDGLANLLKENIEYLNNYQKYILARLTEESSLDEANDIYQSLFNSEIKEIALSRVHYLSQKDQNSEKVGEVSSELFEITNEPYFAFSMLRNGHVPLELPNHPLLMWYASDRGIIEKSDVLNEFNSPGIKARFYLDSLFKTGDQLTKEIESLDTDSYEWDLLWKYRADFLEKEDRKELFKTKLSTKGDVVEKWWLDISPDNDLPPDEIFPLNTISRIRDNEYPKKGNNLSSLSQGLRAAFEELISVKHNKIKKDANIPIAISRNRFFGFFEEDQENLKSVLQNEINISDNSFLRYLLMILSKGEFLPDEDYMLSSWFKESLVDTPIEVWGNTISNRDTEICEIAALRCLLGEEKLGVELSDTFLEKISQPLKAPLILRDGIKNKDIYKVIENIDYISSVNDGDKILKGIIKEVANDQDEGIYGSVEGETGKWLFERALWKGEKWTELYSILLNQIDDDSDGETKSRIYAKMALIDGEGKGDFDNEGFTREAMSNIDYPNGYNFLRLLGKYRTEKNLQSEITIFRKLIETNNLDKEQNNWICELWRLEEIGGMKLPDKNIIQEIQQIMPNDGVLLWWAFNLLGINENAGFLTDYFIDLKESSNIFRFIQCKSLVKQEKYEEASTMIKEIIEEFSMFLPLVDLGILTSIKRKNGNDFAFFLNHLTDNFTSDGEGAFNYYLIGLAINSWDGSSENSIPYFQKSLEEDGSFKNSFLFLNHLQKEAGNSEELARLLEFQIEKEEVKELRLRYMRDLGTLYFDKLESFEEGLVTFIEYLKDIPFDLEVLDVVCNMLEKNGEYYSLIDYLQDYLKYEKNKENKASLYKRLALAFDKTEQFDDAIKSYLKSLELNKDQFENWHRLYELYLAKEEYKYSLRALKAAIGAIQDEQKKIELYIQKGKLFEDGFKDKKSAQESFQKAVDMSKGGIDAVTEFARFFDRHHDPISKNIKIDMLWNKEIKNIELQQQNNLSLSKICHYLKLKDEDEMAVILSEAALTLGVEKSLLPSKPSKKAVDPEILTNEDVLSLIYREHIQRSYQNFFHLISEESWRMNKELYKKMIPDRKKKLASIPPLLKDFLDEIDVSCDIYEDDGNDVKVLPFENPIILLPKIYKKLKTIEEWRFLVGGQLILFKQGFLTLLNLEDEHIYQVMAGIIHFAFPNRNFDDLDDEIIEEYSKIAGKTLGRYDKSRYGGMILELDKISVKKAKLIKEDLIKTQYILGYLVAGSMKDTVNVLDFTENQNAKEELTRFIFSKNHLKIRHIIESS